MPSRVEEDGKALFIEIFPKIRASLQDSIELPRPEDFKDPRIKRAIEEAWSMSERQRLAFQRAGKVTISRVRKHLEKGRYSSRPTDEIRHALARLNPALSEHAGSSPTSLTALALWTRIQLNLIRAPLTRSINFRGSEREQLHGLAWLIPTVYYKHHVADLVNEILLAAFRTLMAYQICKLVSPEKIRQPRQLLPYFEERVYRAKRGRRGRPKTRVFRVNFKTAASATPPTAAPDASKKRARSRSASTHAPDMDDQRPQKKLRSEPTEQNQDPVATIADAADKASANADSSDASSDD